MPRNIPKAGHSWRLSQGLEASTRRPYKGRNLPKNYVFRYTDPANRHSRIYSHILDLYFQEMGKYNRLDEKEFAELDAMILDGQAELGRRTLVLHTLRYAINAAHKYCNNGIPFLDLIQAANCGLLIAAVRYDPGRKCYFLTYADWWIRSEIFNDLNFLGRHVRIPKHQYHYRVLSAMSKLRVELEQEATPEEVASCLGLPVDAVKDCMFRIKTGRDVPLASHVSHDDDDARTYQELIQNREVLNPEQYVIAKDELYHAGQVIQHFMSGVKNTFGERTFMIVALRYGLDGTRRNKTLDEIGHQVDLTRERVRQIINTFWKEVVRQKRCSGQAWFEGRLDAIEILENTLGEELTPIKLV